MPNACAARTVHARSYAVGGHCARYSATCDSLRAVRCSAGSALEGAQLSAAAAAAAAPLTRCAALAPIVPVKSLLPSSPSSLLPFFFSVAHPESLTIGRFRPPPLTTPLLKAPDAGTPPFYSSLFFELGFVAARTRLRNRNRAARSLVSQVRSSRDGSIPNPAAFLPNHNNLSRCNTHGTTLTSSSTPATSHSYCKVRYFQLRRVLHLPRTRALRKAERSEGKTEGRASLFCRSGCVLSGRPCVLRLPMSSPLLRTPCISNLL